MRAWGQEAAAGTLIPTGAETKKSQQLSFPWETLALPVPTRRPDTNPARHQMAAACFPAITYGTINFAMELIIILLLIGVIGWVIWRARASLRAEKIERPQL